MKITVYQKPTCSTCRNVIKELTAAGEEFECVNYYEEPLTANTLRALCKKLGISPSGILRKKEPIYKEIDLDKRTISDDELIELMIAHPDLIQRPIVVKGKKAVLARPVEEWKKILEG